jgi:hypothetical protein
LAIFVVEYLREYESIFETALAHESVGLGVLFDVKKPEVDILVRLSLLAGTNKLEPKKSNQLELEINMIVSDLGSD